MELISKTAFISIYMLGVAWFVIAAVYTYKSVFKDFAEMFKSNK